MALQGKKGSLVSIENLLEWYLTTAGHAKASTTDAQVIPFVNATGGIDIDDETTKGPGGEDMAYGQGAKKVSGTIQTEASDLAFWAAIVAMITPVTANDTVTKDLNGQLFAFGKNGDGQFYNFWQKPDLQDFTGTPGCSTSFSAMGTKLHIGNDSRHVEIHLEGWESDAQTQYRVTQATAYDTAAAITGAVTSGATIVDTSRAGRVLDKGFHTITINGEDMGILSDGSFEDELTGGAEQQNKSAVLQHKITAKGESVQANLGQQGEFSTVSLTDATIVMKSYAGEVITINNARFKGKMHTMGRNKQFVSFEMTSTMPLTSVTFTGTTATYTCNAV